MSLYVKSLQCQDGVQVEVRSNSGSPKAELIIEGSIRFVSRDWWNKFIAKVEVAFNEVEKATKP